MVAFGLAGAAHLRAPLGARRGRCSSADPSPRGSEAGDGPARGDRGQGHPRRCPPRLPSRHVRHGPRTAEVPSGRPCLGRLRRSGRLALSRETLGMSEHRRATIAERFETAPVEKRGRIMIALWCHAVVSTAVNGGLAASVALSAMRIWRDRNQGTAPAVRVGGYWRAVTGFALASAGLRVVRLCTTRWIAAGGDARPTDHRPGPL